MNKIICLIAVAALSSHCLLAQTFGLEYTSEMQSDFRDWNWINLLRLRFSQPLGKHCRFELSSLSIAKTRDNRLVDDYQVFSNIEEENLPFTLSLAGLTWETTRSTLFIGIRNMNEDYFTTPAATLFTNSSCGLVPTISCNYPIANYPLASLGIHYAWNSEQWNIQTSVYNGKGYERLAGPDNLFRFCPASDGLFGIASISYHRNGNNYTFGSAIYYGTPDDQTPPTQKSTSGVLWVHVEQRLTPRLYLLFQYSVNPAIVVDCRHYVGAGLTACIRQTEIGFFSDFAAYNGGGEWATELTCKVPVLRTGYIQPAWHLIYNNRRLNQVGLIRLGVLL